MARDTRWQLDTGKLLAAFTATCAARGISQRAACEDLGMQTNIPQKMKQPGYAPDADCVLTLLLWMGHSAPTYATRRPATVVQL
jgi:hypothetical protein